jgi:DNA-binding response OmpR family regulator
MNGFHVLIVEDHEALRETMVDFMQVHGFEVSAAFDARGVEDVGRQRRIDLAVLDIHLSGESGLDICRHLRSVQPSMGLLVVSAYSAPEDRLAAYEAGADFFLSKPVHNEELLGAVRALQRRLAPTEPDAVLVLAQQQLRTPHALVALTAGETQVLHALVLAGDRVLEYWELLEQLQLTPDEGGKAALEVRMVRLRKKLMPALPGANPIRSVYRQGYQLQLRMTLA